MATNDSQGVILALSKSPLVCGDLRGPQTVPCPGAGGPLGTLGDRLAQVLEKDPRWGQRLGQRQRLCRELPGKVWPPASAPPRLRIVPERSGHALALTCHAWGFTPPEVTLRWLRNGEVVGDTRGQSRALPVGDGTFRTQVTIEVAPGTRDTLECSALHPSLQEPVSVTWGESFGGISGDFGGLGFFGDFFGIFGIFLEDFFGFFGIFGGVFFGFFGDFWGNF
uniref:Ig-like domain-containing protein n=1 Tax=Catharus ustulatus TaxID=91951 RepID=A0A8C3UDW8_CATUS